MVSTLQAQIELAPDTLERVDHVRTCDGAVLFEYAWHGTREGGAFANVWLVLIELAPDGLSFAGQWQAEGQRDWKPWTGKRVLPQLYSPGQSPV